MLFGVPIIYKMATYFAHDDVTISPPIRDEEEKEPLQPDYAVDVDISFRAKMMTNGGKLPGPVICDEITDGPESVV